MTPQLSGQSNEILSAGSVQLGPHSGWRKSFGVRATDHLGGHITHPHTPLFIAYGADYVTSNNAKHRTKRETLDPIVH